MTRKLVGPLAVVLLAASIPVLSAPDSVRPKVLVQGLSPQQVEELQKSVPEAEIVHASAEKAEALIGEVDALVGSCSSSLLAKGQKIRWVQTASAGVEGCAPLLAERDITLTNAKILMGPEIADHALALLLALTRSLRQTIPAQASGEWRRSYRPIELRGKTALIIGVGGIGTQIAERAAAFGMRVLGVDPKDIPYINAIDRVVPPDQLKDLLPEADVVFMAAPHTPESEYMLGPEQFSMMKKGAYFISVSRGKTTKTDALVQALESGQLAGAGIDVVDPEPLPPNHPLWKMPNVVVTPHIAGQSDQLDTRRMELYGQNIRRFAKGLPLLNVVDKKKGY